MRGRVYGLDQEGKQSNDSLHLGHGFAALLAGRQVLFQSPRLLWVKRAQRVCGSPVGNVILVTVVYICQYKFNRLTATSTPEASTPVQ